MKGPVAPNPTNPCNNNANTNQNNDNNDSNDNNAPAGPNAPPSNQQVPNKQPPNQQTPNQPAPNQPVPHQPAPAILLDRSHLYHLLLSSPLHNSQPQLISLVLLHLSKLATTFSTSTCPSNNSPTDD